MHDHCGSRNIILKASPPPPNCQFIPTPMQAAMTQRRPLLILALIYPDGCGSRQSNKMDFPLDEIALVHPGLD